MVVREPKDKSSVCYFCLNYLIEINCKSKHTVKYPDFQSAMRPVPHREELLPVPKPPQNVLVTRALNMMKGMDSTEWTMLIAIDTRSKLFLIWPPLIYTRRLQLPCPWFCDFNISKQQAALFKVQTKKVHSSPPRYWNEFLSQSSKLIQRIFL